MFCNNCGASLTPGQNFCSKCGQQLVTAAPPPVHEPPVETRPAPVSYAQSRVEKHIRILAILWLVVSIFGLIPGLWIFLGSRMAMHFMPFFHFGFPFRAFIWPLAGVIGSLFLVSAVLGLLAGWGLLNYRPWARMLTMFLGAIGLIRFPFGTALGIYTLWVLLPADSEREYDRLARTGY